MNKEKCPIEGALFTLQELGFKCNELKKSGAELIPISSFTELLDWTIDTVVAVKEYSDKLKYKMGCDYSD